MPRWLGPLGSKEVAAAVLPENVKFVADNEAELTRLLESLNAFEKSNLTTQFGV